MIGAHWREIWNNKGIGAKMLEYQSELSSELSRDDAQPDSKKFGGGGVSSYIDWEILSQSIELVESF